jgi:RNA polymerase sigma-70 factor (sigma-E family)
MATDYDAEFLDFAEASRTRLRRAAFLMCGDWDHASDITQEALVRLYLAWPRIDKGAGLASYARRTVISIAIDRARKKSSSELPDATLGTDSPAAAADDIEGVVDRITILNALARLAPRQRACVVLRYYEDLSVAEVARVLGCREGTVKSQTARGLDTLREHLGTLELTEEAAS